MQVQGDEEAQWFEQTRDAYLTEAQYTDSTDIRDLDRLLVHELMVFRWTKQIGSGRDYDDLLIDEQDLQRNIKLYSDQITKIKESMGLTRKVRDAAANAESVADYLSNLKARAKQFGVHREEQLDKALTLFEELSAVVGAFQRASEEERKKIGFPDEASVLEWITETAIPEYRVIDEHFRKNEQRYFVRSI